MPLKFVLGTEYCIYTFEYHSSKNNNNKKDSLKTNYIGQVIQCQFFFCVLIYVNIPLCLHIHISMSIVDPYKINVLYIVIAKKIL